MTFVVYAALGGVLFFLVLQLQAVSGYGALRAGLATLPVTICMLLLASKGGALGVRIGPRVPMTLGPLVMAAGTLLLRVGADPGYWTDVLPGLVSSGPAVRSTRTRSPSMRRTARRRSCAPRCWRWAGWCPG